MYRNFILSLNKLNKVIVRFLILFHFSIVSLTDFRELQMLQRLQPVEDCSIEGPSTDSCM